MKKLLLALSLIFGSLVGASTYASTTTFEGQIVKVVPAKKEIYVQSEGKKHELYFKENTKLLQDGVAVDFAALVVDQRVKVEATQVGKRLDPLTVEILK